MELESLLSDSESRLMQAQGQQHVAQRSTEDLRQELDNNAGRLLSLHLCWQHTTDLHELVSFWAHTAMCFAVVFKMHYTELLSKDDEIAKLKAVVDALSKK